MEYLNTLNTAQRAAVEQLDGPLLVLAGAGTGKTKVLTTRLAHLLTTRHAFPGEVMAVTFTNKAAKEMKHRVSDLLGGQPVEGWWLGTFHALAGRMLRRHADLVGLSQNYTILDPDDVMRLIKQLMVDFGVDVKKYNPKIARALIDRWKDRALTPDKVSTEEAGDFARGQMVQIYKTYQHRLKTLNACDFGDLLLHMITIFQGHPDVLADYHQRFKYMMVDEYQDTNVAQYLWLRLLAQQSRNICVVGDDDQSIYGWRGAEVGNILRFEKDFPGAQIVRLEENYRSTQNILSAADHVIANNENRLGKTLRSQKGAGEVITVHGLWDGEAEARWVAEMIEGLTTNTSLRGRGKPDAAIHGHEASESGLSNLEAPSGNHPMDCHVADAPRNDGYTHKHYTHNQIAILVRAGYQMREFEERFLTLNIPYRVIGGPRFYERMEIRDTLAYLRVTAQPHDDLALGRIINTPKRGLGQSTIQKLYDYGRGNGLSLHDSIIALCRTDQLKPKQCATLQSLVDSFAVWRGKIETLPHPELAALILEESGYMAMWKADKSVEARGRVENLEELISAMADFESLAAFLEHIALVMEAQEDQSQNKVTIMTLHGAKGLEFDCVFLPGWEEGLFPSQRAMDETGLKGLEEERRLAYVGITRAKEKLFISHAANRRTYGNWINAIPSRFIGELPDDAVESSSAIKPMGMGGMGGTGGGYNATRSRHWDSSGMEIAPRRESQYQQMETAGGIKNGSRVVHSAFGEGTVIMIDGNKLDIQFDTQGRKRVLDRFVEAV